MKIIKAKPGDFIVAGQQGEELARRVEFDIAEWERLYGPGTVQLLVKRMTDETFYPTAIEQEQGVAVWNVTVPETSVAGKYHTYELRYYARETLAKAVGGRFSINEAFVGEDGEVPEVHQGWVDQIIATGAGSLAAQKAAEAARDEADKRAKDAIESANAAARSEQESKELAKNISKSVAAGVETIQAEGNTQIERVALEGATQVEAVGSLAMQAKENADGAALSEKNAKTSEESAVQSEINARKSAESADLSAGNASIFAKNAADFAGVANKAELDAKLHAKAAEESKQNARVSEAAAAESEQNVKSYEENVGKYVANAALYASNAEIFANNAAQFADEASKQAASSKFHAQDAAKSAQEAKEAAQNAGGGVSSWNDLTDKPDSLAYVEEGGMVEILPETTVEFNDAEGMVEGAIPLIVGETYTVNWNGTEYVCVAQDASAVTGAGTVVVGNGAVVGLIGNDEPFIIVSVQGDGVTAMIAMDGSAEAVVSIKCEHAVVHKLDNRCLDLAWLPTMVEDGYTNVVFEDTLKFMSPMTYKEFGLSLVAGNKYKVYWNGAEYELTAKEINDGVQYAIWMGNGSLIVQDGIPPVDTGEPFLIVTTGAVDGELVMTSFTKNTNNSEDISLKIVGTGYVPNKLPAEFLPDTVATKADIFGAMEASY